MLKYRMMGSKSLTYNHFRRNLNFGSYFLTSVGRDSSRPAGVSVSAINSLIYRSNMKKVFMFASAAIAALAMVSCNKEIEIQDQIADGICPDGYYVEELVAEYPRDPETRTAFNETTGKFAWTEGDELAFHLSNGTYTSAAIDPATSKVKLYLPVGVTRDNYAVYPASAVVDEAAEIGNMQVTLPSTYDISGNLTTDYVPMPLIANNAAENKKLKFEHVGALLQVNLNVPAGVRTATLSMGKTITGTFDLESGTGNGIIEAGEISDDALTFILSEEGLTTDTAVKLLAPLPSGTYEKFEVAYDNGFAFTKDLSSMPWEFDRTQGKKVSISNDNFEDSRDYFWIKNIGTEVGVVAFQRGKRRSTSVSLDYSIGNKSNWMPFFSSETTTSGLSILSDTIELSPGEVVYFKGDNPRIGFFDSINVNSESSLSWYTTNFPGESYYCCFVLNNSVFSCGGDLMSLKSEGSKMQQFDFYKLFADCKNLTDASELHLSTELSPACYERLFYGCSNLVNAPDLPALTLAAHCYNGMFDGCTSLTSAPELPARELAPYCYCQMFGSSGIIESPDLPATSLAMGCYYRMFAWCNDFTSAPELPAAILEKKCYMQMFNGCSVLETAPVLPATTLAESCYQQMFINCVALETTPVLPATTLAASCYYSMFQGCTSLTSAPELPVQTLAEKCYSYMFNGCTSLATAPELPAQILAGNCYSSMFQGCTSLTSAPELPAQVLAESCYTGMFYGCTSLTTAPELPAQSLAGSCYSYMFYGCTSLATVPELPAQALAESCYYCMFRNCSSLTSAPELPATTLAKGCYKEMFWNCTSLTESPKLEADVLMESCYEGMFYGCSSLVNGPESLGSTVAEKSCYMMFQNCASLKVAPVLLATSLKVSCYRQMFLGCTSLEEVKVSFTSWPSTDSANSSDEDYCATYCWFSDAKNKNTCQFIKPAELPVSRGIHNIPSAWTVVNYSE